MGAHDISVVGLVALGLADRISPPAIGLTRHTASWTDSGLAGSPGPHRDLTRCVQRLPRAVAAPRATRGAAQGHHRTLATMENRAASSCRPVICVVNVSPQPRVWARNRIARGLGWTTSFLLEVGNE